MKSRGGKREYSCPECGSTDITGPKQWFYQKSGDCNACNSWWPWRRRIKKPIVTVQEEVNG